MRLVSTHGQIQHEKKERQESSEPHHNGETNQESERQVCNDGKRNGHARELEITNVPDKNARERIDAVVTQNVEGNGGCNRPQFDRFYIEHTFGILESFQGRRVALIARWEEQGGSLVEHRLLIRRRVGLRIRSLDFQGNHAFSRVW